MFPKIKYLVFSLVPLLVLVAVLEFGLRAYYYIKDGGYRYRIERLVELESAGPYYKEDSKVANELGFSGKGKFDPAKIPDEYRILVLGGSGVAGGPDSNWPDEMAAALNGRQTKRPVRVLNGGIGGHTSSGEKKFMVRWMKLKPDLVIIYDGWNDMYYSRYLPEEYREQFDISQTYYYPDLGERIEDLFARHSILFRKLKIFAEKFKEALKGKRSGKKKAEEYDPLAKGAVPVALNQDMPAGKKDDFIYTPGRPFKTRLDWRKGLKIKTIDPEEPIRDDMSQVYRANLHEMVDLAKRNNARVILVVQPDLLYHFSERRGLFEEEEEDILTVIKHGGLREDWIRTTRVLYPKVHEAMLEVAGTNDNVIGVYRIEDIFDEYPEKRRFWLESCHQTPEGRKIIGEYIADIVYGEILRGKK